jgi:hypothetical protein
MRTGDCKTWLQTVESPGKETLCLQNVDWIKRHLRFCDSHNHAGQASSFQPSRLLDLGVDETNVDFRLIQTSDREPASILQYAALSYCWGPEQDAKHQLRTLSLNLSQHHERIQFDASTRVVQDAITTARALSIRYLWIDALCIIQDDANDWRKESGQMGMIYAHAYVTICTPTSNSCMEGFLARPPSINIKFRSKLRPDIQGIYSLRHQKGRDSLVYASSMSISAAMEEQDLNFAGTWPQRAWTLQERHLSKRRLYFGYSRLYLHCSAEGLREPLDYCLFPRANFHNSFRDQVLRYKKDQNMELLHDDWVDLIDEYIHCQATYEVDVFPAISGLARIMASEVNDEYVAGLWKKDLPRGLLWTVYNGYNDWSSLLHRITPGLSKPYIAPSWSWASIGHDYVSPKFTTHATVIGYGEEVRLRRQKLEVGFRSECCVVVARCVPVSAEMDIYGQITHGELHVEGKLKKCGSTWVRDPRSGYRGNRWTVVDDTPAIVCAFDISVSPETKEIQLNNLSVLLLSSSCGYHMDWPRRRHYEEASAPVDNSPPDSVYDPMTESTRLTYFKMSQRLKNIYGDDDEEEDSEHPKQETDKESNDSMSRRSRRPPEVSTPREVAKQRNAWGLLLHPLAGTDKFVRVGVLRVSFEHGGLRCFDDEPVSLVKLV